MTAPAESAAQAFTTSAHSLKALAAAIAPLIGDQGGSLVGLDFDATVGWPIYDWIGVAKAALESVARYLARVLGPNQIRVNLVSAGPLGTVAAEGIPGFEQLAEVWRRQAPLGWDHRGSGAGGEDRLLAAV
jgi:enoyl ACP reductase